MTSFRVIAVHGTTSCKASRNTLYEAVREVLPGNQRGSWKFWEMVELHITLNICGSQKDKSFLGTIGLKSTPCLKSLYVFWGTSNT